MLLMTRRDALKARRGTRVLAARGAAAEPTRVVTDHLGRRVTLPLRIDRAVVADIYPFASVAAIFLGGCGKLAGMSPVSMSAARHGDPFPDLSRYPEGQNRLYDRGYGECRSASQAPASGRVRERLKPEDTG